MTPIPRFLVLSNALACLGVVFVGCAGFDPDPRRTGAWTLTATASTGIETTSATLTRHGPSPFWVEPTAEIVVIAADGESTATATLRYGTDSAESAGLVARIFRYAVTLLVGRASAGAFP